MAEMTALDWTLIAYAAAVTGWIALLAALLVLVVVVPARRREEALTILPAPRPRTWVIVDAVPPAPARPRRRVSRAQVPIWVTNPHRAAVAAPHADRLQRTTARLRGAA